MKRVTRYPRIIQELSREPWIFPFCSSTILLCFVCHDPQTGQQRAVSLSVSCFFLLFRFFFFFFVCFYIIFVESFLTSGEVFGQEELNILRVAPLVKIQWKSSENPVQIQGIQEKSRVPDFYRIGHRASKNYFLTNKVVKPHSMGLFYTLFNHSARFHFPPDPWHPSVILPTAWMIEVWKSFTLICSLLIAIWFCCGSVIVGNATDCNAHCFCHELNLSVLKVCVNQLNSEDWIEAIKFFLDQTNAAMFC